MFAIKHLSIFNKFEYLNLIHFLILSNLNFTNINLNEKSLVHLQTFQFRALLAKILRNFSEMGSIESQHFQGSCLIKNREFRQFLYIGKNPKKIGIMSQVYFKLSMSRCRLLLTVFEALVNSGKCFHEFLLWDFHGNLKIGGTESFVENSIRAFVSYCLIMICKLNK